MAQTHYFTFDSNIIDLYLKMNFFGGDNAANNANILAAAKIEFDTFAEMYGK